MIGVPNFTWHWFRYRQISKLQERNERGFFCHPRPLQHRLPKTLLDHPAKEWSSNNSHHPANLKDKTYKYLKILDCWTSHFHDLASPTASFDDNSFLATITDKLHHTRWRQYRWNSQSHWSTCPLLYGGPSLILHLTAIFNAILATALQWGYDVDEHPLKYLADGWLEWYASIAS